MHLGSLPRQCIEWLYGQKSGAQVAQDACAMIDAEEIPATKYRFEAQLSVKTSAQCF